MPEYKWQDKGFEAQMKRRHELVDKKFLGGINEDEKKEYDALNKSLDKHYEPYERIIEKSFDKKMKCYNHVLEIFKSIKEDINNDDMDSAEGKMLKLEKYLKRRIKAENPQHL